MHTVPRYGRQARRLEQGSREREAKRPRIFPGTIHEKIDLQDGDIIAHKGGDDLIHTPAGSSTAGMSPQNAPAIHPVTIIKGWSRGAGKPG